MGKKLIFVFFLCFLIISVFIIKPVEVNAYRLISLDFYSGGNYNTYNLSVFEEWVNNSYGVEEKFNGGFGYYFGTRQWVGIGRLENLAFGGEIELMNVSYSEIDVSLSNMGILLTAAYRLSGMFDDFRGEILLIGAGGIYLANLVDEELDIGRIEENYLGPGFKIVLESSFPLTQQLSIGGRGGYRFSQPHSEGDINFSGFEVGLKVELSF